MIKVVRFGLPQVHFKAGDTAVSGSHVPFRLNTRNAPVIEMVPRFVGEVKCANGRPLNKYVPGTCPPFERVSLNGYLLAPIFMPVLPC